LSVIKLFERYSSLRNTTLIPPIDYQSSELDKYLPLSFQSSFSTKNPSRRSTKIPLAALSTIPDTRVTKPTPAASLLQNIPFITSTRLTPGILIAFADFINDIGQAISNLLSSLADAYANNPVLTILTLAALAFFLFNFLINSFWFGWFGKKRYRGWHGYKGYHKRMDRVNDTADLDDAYKLQKILDIIDEYELKYGEKIFM
jgi:hypothetical protein